MEWRPAVGLALFVACAAVLVAGAAVRRRVGGSPLREAGADGLAGAVVALIFVAFGLATAPVAAVYGLGVGALPSVAVAGAGAAWLVAMVRSRRRSGGGRG
jgi:hypothetical protein